MSARNQRERPDVTWFFKQTPPPGVTPTIKIKGENREGSAKIRCPKCQWRPSPSSRWSCLGSEGSPEPPFPGCGSAWNTFETRGRCPSCDHQWRFTACLKCGDWSPHIEWYEISDSTH
jgi:hypothetical protein